MEEQSTGGYGAWLVLGFSEGSNHGTFEAEGATEGAMEGATEAD